MSPRIHVYGSTDEAYASAQCDLGVQDGDVLSVPSERVVGFLFGAWPVAVSVLRGAFHAWTKTTDELEAFDGGRYRESVKLAHQEYARLLELGPMDAAVNG